MGFKSRVRRQDKKPSSVAPTKEELENALQAANGNITRTALALQTYRIQIRRWMKYYGIKNR